jgi:calmodulin
MAGFYPQFFGRDMVRLGKMGAMGRRRQPSIEPAASHRHAFDGTIRLPQPGARAMSSVSDQELRDNFDHFDSNGDGKLELAEFVALLEALDAVAAGEDPAIGFRAIDSDGSGIVEFDEFVAWFQDR